MNALVGYGSSDDEDDDIQPEKPSKIAKTAARAASVTDGDHAHASMHGESNEQPPEPPPHHPTSTRPGPAPALSLQSHHNAAPQPPPTPPSAALGPAIGPSMPTALSPSPTSRTSAPSQPSTPPLSPYTAQRQRRHDLTLPRSANFSIPASPPAPSGQTWPGRAAAHAATTARFERFLALKRGAAPVHFHARLRASAALRNPALLPELLRFAGVTGGEGEGDDLAPDAYRSSLPEGAGAVPVVWAPECYVEGLMRENERRGKARRAGRERVEFIAAGRSEGHGGQGMGEGEGSGGGTDKKRSRFG